MIGSRQRSTCPSTSKRASPGRFAEGTRLALQFPRLLQVRDRPEYLPGFEKGDQFMLLVMDSKGRFTPPEETTLYAMMPQDFWMYRITEGEWPGGRRNQGPLPCPIDGGSRHANWNSSG